MRTQSLANVRSTSPTIIMQLAAEMIAISSVRSVAAFFHARTSRRTAPTSALVTAAAPTSPVSHSTSMGSECTHGIPVRCSGSPIHVHPRAAAGT